MKAIGVVFFVFVSVGAWGQVMFQKTYQGSAAGEGASVYQLSDSGYLVGGNILIRTNVNGDTIFTRDLGWYHKDVVQTPDKGYILANMPVKLDSIANVEWAKNIEGALGQCWYYSVINTIDGGYLFIGECEDTSTAHDALSLLKLDTFGNLSWSKLHDFYLFDDAFSIIPAPDSCFLAVGTAATAGILLAKINFQGDVLWAKSYGDGSCYGYSVAHTQDGGYVIAGSILGNGRDCYLIKTDSSGIPEWSKTYGGSNHEEALSVKQTSDLGYIVAGFTSSFGAGNGDVYLIRTDSNGDTLWTRTYGGANNDIGYSVQQTFDGGFAIVGWTLSFGSGSQYVYFIKTDANGNSGCNENNTSTVVTNLSTVAYSSSYIDITPPDVTTATANFHSVYLASNVCSTTGYSFNDYLDNPGINISPNPTTSNSSITITYPFSEEKSEVIIYDVTGKEVARYALPAHGREVKVQLPLLAKGMYVARFTGSSESGFQRGNVKFAVQ